MKIGGIQGVSFIDYPGAIGTIVFTSGCNFRCPYCHNPELVDETAKRIPESEVLSFLNSRKTVLDAVTITGGEPTLHDDLLPFMKKIKDMGYRIKLDTNGTNPQMVRSALEAKLVDYLAMDIKAPLERYHEVTQRPTHISAIKESIELLKQSGVSYEFRTTVVRGLLTPDDLEAIAKAIQGAPQYYLQKFISTKILNPAFIRKTTYTDLEFEQIRSRISPYVGKCIIRS